MITFWTYLRIHPLEQTDIESFLVAEISEELYVSVQKAYKALRSVKTKKLGGPN